MTHETKKKLETVRNIYRRQKEKRLRNWFVDPIPRRRRVNGRLVPMKVRP